MSDLVKELRESAEEAYYSGAGLADAPCRLFDEAANEIERLRKIEVAAKAYLDRFDGTPLRHADEKELWAALDAAVN